MRISVFITSLIFSLTRLWADVDWEVLSSTPEELMFIVTVSAEHPSILYPFHLLIGLPTDEYPSVNVTYQEKRPCPGDCNKLEATGVEWIQKQKLQRLNTATLKIAPYAGNNEYYSRILITILFEAQFQGSSGRLSKNQERLLSVRVLNWKTAQRWVKPFTRKRITEDGQSYTNLQNLTASAEYIILGPEEFADASQVLLDYRTNSSNNPLKSVFVPVEQVYEDFGDGHSEAEAIRLFFQNAIENWSDSLAFALLMGDVDKVPTMYGGSGSDTWATDDLLVAPNPGKIPLIAIGRYPARHENDITAFIDKVIEYESNPVIGLWRQRVTLVADDVARPYINDTDHINYSEILTRYIPPQLEVEKIYLTEYPEVSDASAYGVVKPAATKALFDILHKGTAIVNFIGHGSAQVWAQEQLLQKDRGDINSIQTGMKLPIWIAGTCAWGFFDDENNDAFSEDIIRLPKNGASAIITTTRSISYISNWLNVRAIFNSLFQHKSVTLNPIGVVLQSTKTGGMGGQLFHLFGDPAMKIAIPTNTLSIASVTPDPILTLEPAQFTGYQNITDNNGSGYVILKDADNMVTREFSYYSSGWKTNTISYTLPGPTLFRGQFTFTGNIFSGEFWLPKDISYSENPGRLNIYVISDEDTLKEALGSLDSLFFIAGGSIQDSQGPIISFGTETRILQSGDHVRENESLFIRISDLKGINLTGEVGHEIMLTDLNSEQTTDITDQFVYDPDDITSGTIPLNRDDFSNNIHISVKAWDNANNPAEKEVQLILSEVSEIRLFQVTNFPNPFRSSTQFVFEITAPADVSVDVYTLNGRKILSIDEQPFSTGYHTIDWDGRDAYGGQIANGVYLYRLKATGDGSSASIIGRLAKFR